MGKDAAGRRTWVKNVAIIFLAVLLLLTFFSNTILNYSLPEVSAQYARYGSISSAVKLNGTVKANENYSVVYEEAAAGDGGVTQTRKVVSVYVREGDTVAVGAPILALQGGASEELKKAEADLEAKEREYQLALLNDKVSTLNGDKTIADAEQAIADAEAELAKLNELYAKLLSGTDTTGVIEDQIKALEKSVKTMTKQKTEADAKIMELEGKISAAENQIEDDFSGVPLADRLRLAEEEYAELELQYYALKDAAEETEKALESLKEQSGSMGEAGKVIAAIESYEAQFDELEKTVNRKREDFAESLRKAARTTELTEGGSGAGGTAGSGAADSETGNAYTAVEIDGESTPETDKAAENTEAVVLVSAHLQILEPEVWVELEKSILRSYDWEDVENNFRSILRKALSKAGVDISDDTVAAEIDEYIVSVEDSVKAHKRSLEDYDEDLREIAGKLEDERKKLDILDVNPDSADSLAEYEMTQKIAAAEKENELTQKELTDITKKYEDAKASVESLTKQNQQSDIAGEYRKQLAVYEAESENLEQKLEEANETIEELREDLADAGDGMSKDPEDVLEQIENKKKDIEAAETSLAITKAQGEVSSTTTKYDREAQLKEIENLKAKIETYKNAPETTDVTAPIAGRIVSVNFVPGNTVTSGATVAQIEISEKGYICEVTLPSDEARKIQVGAECTVTNSWWYSSLEAKVAQIRSDPQSQGKNRIVVIEVKGDVYDGQSLTFSIGDKSQSYDAVLPNSAIREDSEGKFVLTVESRKTPLGVRYTARRYDVEIIASDDTQSAVSGLYGSEFVIINATSPVSDGQQVRLAET